MQKSGLKKHPIVKHTKNSNTSNLATFGHYEKDVIAMQNGQKWRFWEDIKCAITTGKFQKNNFRFVLCKNMA